jgi:hypothetical protein
MECGKSSIWNVIAIVKCSILNFLLWRLYMLSKSWLRGWVKGLHPIIMFDNLHAQWVCRFPVDYSLAFVGDTPTKAWKAFLKKYPDYA